MNTGDRSRSGGRILVVDDERAFREFLKELLEAGGYAVLLAADGREALRLLESECPDLLLLDVLMDEMDGLEVIEAIRHRGLKLPVIVMSGGGRLDPHTYLDTSLHLGAGKVLRKPFTGESLLDAVSAMLGGC